VEGDTTPELSGPFPKMHGQDAQRCFRPAPESYVFLCRHVHIATARADTKAVRLPAEVNHVAENLAIMTDDFLLLSRATLKSLEVAIADQGY
jgi:hypothetical protein